MAWYNDYTLAVPATGTALPSGWTDVGGVWTSQTSGSGRVLQITDTSASSPWQNRQLVRKATAEASQNTRVQIRWMITAGTTGGAPFVYLRYVPNTTDASANGYAVKVAQYIPVTAGSLGTSVAGSGTIANSTWYDTQVSAVTSGGTTTITETTTNVTNPFSDAFGGGTSVASNSYTTSTFNAVSGGEGIFAYQPGTLSIAQFNSFSDVAATALTFAPTSASGPAGTAISFTVGPNGAQNGGAITLSDGGAGGTFSATSVTVASGVGQTAAFTYNPASGSAGTNVTITGSSSALTGSAISGTVVIAVSAGPATALTLSPSTQSLVSGNTSSTITCAANGTLSASKTINLTDGSSGGTFNPTSLTLTTGATSATFTYTPAITASGTITLTAAVSGGGLTNGTATITATPPAGVLTPGTSSALVFSPYNWVTGLSNSAVSGATAARCWNPGAYMRAYVTGTTSVSIMFGASNTSATFVYQIDDGLPSAAIACPSGANYAITLPDTGAHVITWTLQTLPQATGRWAGTNAVVINGVQLGTGGAAGTAVQGNKYALIYGDSIQEGFESRDGSTGVTTSTGYHLAQALIHQGWEVGIKAASNSGLAWPTPSGSGGQPVAYTSGNDTLSSWNKVDGSGAGGAALTVGTTDTSGERFMQQPNLIVECWGTNDGITANNISDTATQTTAQGLYGRLRVTAPNAVIVKMVPFGGYKRAALTAAVAAMNDAKLILVDRKADALMTTSGYCSNLVTGTTGSDAIHPWALGSAQLACWLVGVALAAYTPWATARASGGVS